MARKYRRRRRKAGNSLMSKVKSVVKREVGKTRETQKLVSYLSWTGIPPLIDLASGAPDASQGLLLSLTGGVNPEASQTVQDPASYNDKMLFVLLPAGTDPQTAQQAGQGGMQMTQDESTGIGQSSSIGGIHQLEGRQCFLKTWYASLILSNSPTQVVDPRPCFVRMIVFETRRPLAQASATAPNLAQQIFLQNHAVAAMTAASVTSPETVNSYINRGVIKKVFFDKLIKLTGPPGAAGAGASSAQLYTRKLKVRINRKAHWSFYYPTRTPSVTGERLVYQGPFIYCIFLGNNGGDGDRFPKIAMNTMLTFYDD